MIAIKVSTNKVDYYHITQLSLRDNLPTFCLLFYNRPVLLSCSVCHVFNYCHHLADSHWQRLGIISAEFVDWWAAV